MSVFDNTLSAVAQKAGFCFPPFSADLAFGDMLWCDITSCHLLFLLFFLYYNFVFCFCFLNRQQKMAEREKRFMEQQRKKMEKEAQRMMKKEQKIAVKLS